MKHNIPAVPEYQANQVVKAIQKDFLLDDDEIEEIKDIVNCHSCEFSVIVEKVSYLLGIEYYRVRELLSHL